METEKIVQAIKDGKAIIKHNENWKYPQLGDDQRSCPMIDFMFQIEYKPGTLIFIPDNKNGGN
jgi:hypothetical protein